MNETKRTLDTLELVGGTLCLDFANTINSRHDPEHDYLLSYSDLVDWAGKVKLLSAQRAKNLKQKANQESKNENKTLEKAHVARETIYRIFSAVANKLQPKEDDLRAITRLYEEAISNGQHVKVENHYEIAWKADETLDGFLWSIISSAENLLLSEELSRVKECPNCGWLFLDTSKNQSRRWCSMNTCGAREKMRRYHSRLRKK